MPSQLSPNLLQIQPWCSEDHPQLQSDYLSEKGSDSLRARVQRQVPICDSVRKATAFGPRVWRLNWPSTQYWLDGRWRDIVQIRQKGQWWHASVKVQVNVWLVCPWHREAFTCSDKEDTCRKTPSWGICQARSGPQRQLFSEENMEIMRHI